MVPVCAALVGRSSVAPPLIVAARACCGAAAVAFSALARARQEATASRAPRSARARNSNAGDSASKDDICCKLTIIFSILNASLAITHRVGAFFGAPLTRSSQRPVALLAVRRFLSLLLGGLGLGALVRPVCVFR